MTPDQDALLDALFTRYGSPARETELRATCYCIRPDQLDTLDAVAWRDKDTARMLAQLDTMTAQLKAYRAALAQRYSEIATTPTVPAVRLKRERSWRDSHVYYHLILSRLTPETGAEVETSRTTYPGTQRSAALAAYHAYVKAHPGISATLDIDKSAWER